jgi:hypothetical protein
MHPLLIFVLLLLLSFAWVFWQRHVKLKREAYVREAELPRGLFEKLRATHPQLTTKDCQLVAQGLRQFFLCYLKSGRKFVSMPSQVVDDLWHEFILYTRHYDAFCRKAFGGFLHHIPAVVLSGNRQKNAGLRRCWWFACKEENINPKAAKRLPLLFALDTKLKIAGGFRYVPDCTGVRRDDADGGATGAYCGGEFSNSSHDGSLDGWGDASHDSSSGDFSGTGDSGGGSDGCGGGGCGGGD